MKNNSMIGLQSRNILLIFGTTVALLVSTSSQMQMVSASVEGGTPVSNASKSNQSANPYGSHVIPPTNAEQSQGNLSAAEGCSPMDPRCNADISCETDPGKCVPPNNAEQSQGGSQGSVPASGSSGDSSNPNQEAVNHINQAQSALQNGDTAGAQQHMDLAKQALGCSLLDPQC